MNCSETSNLCSNKFTLIKSLKDYVNGNYKHIYEVALINLIDDG